MQLFDRAATYSIYIVLQKSFSDIQITRAFLHFEILVLSIFAQLTDFSFLHCAESNIRVRRICSKVRKKKKKKNSYAFDDFELFDTQPKMCII